MSAANSIALRFAWRELRHGARALRGFGVFLGCLALGVAAIAGVQSTATSIVTGLRADGREILGGDLALRSIYQDLAPAERRLLEQASEAITHFAEMRTMARRPGGEASVLVELKAVDERYPLFGRVETAGGEGTDASLAAVAGTPRRGLGGAGGPRARRSAGAPGRRRALDRRHRLRGAGDHHARARPGRLRCAVRVLAPGPGEPRRTRRHAVAARGQPRLSPVRGAACAGGPPGGSAGGPRQGVRGLGLADAYLRERRARNPAHDRPAGLVPEPGRPDRAPGRRGRGRQCGARLARHAARGDSRR